MATSNEKPHNSFSVLQFIRTIYLSAAAIVGLIMFVIGASGGIRLVINTWILPVDETLNYYSPYEKSPCAYEYIDGKHVPRAEAEIEKCEVETEESRKLQATNNFRRELAQSIATAGVGLPVWLFHFWLIQIDWKRRREI